MKKTKSVFSSETKTSKHRNLRQSIKEELAFTTKETNRSVDLKQPTGDEISLLMQLREEIHIKMVNQQGVIYAKALTIEILSVQKKHRHSISHIITCP